MSVEGCSKDHSSVERPVREIPRWKVPCTRQCLGSPVEFSLPYIDCWSRWVDQLYGDGHTIPLVGELGCGNLLDRWSCQGKSAVRGKFDYWLLECCRTFLLLRCLWCAVRIPDTYLPLILSLSLYAGILWGEREGTLLVPRFRIPTVRYCRGWP